MDATIYFAPPSLSPALKGGDGGAFITQMGFPDTLAKAQKNQKSFFANTLTPFQPKSVS